ncbi:MAG: hypothetical protein DWQ04_12435 [Chloroflexi bacterium]|nr:MAG: hypothetical protein DWQ04_12435 [Chloroflexota bacterium]
MPIEEAQKYTAPFKYIERMVNPLRNKNREKRQKEYWWQFARPRPAMRKAISSLGQFVVTTRVAKHRIFAFLKKGSVPDSRLFVIAREDEYFLGVLHSRVHEAWSLATSSRHGDGSDGGRLTYNNTTCFETFSFPWPPGEEPDESADSLVAEIAQWALVQWRDVWLNPPRDGMYAGLGATYDKMLKKRTLTNLYNGLQYYRSTVKSGQLFAQADFDKVTRKSVTRSDIEELDDIHTALDHAVLDAYGWPYTLSDEQILEHLLALNLERAS